MRRTLPEEVTIDLGLDEPSDELHLRQRVARAVGVLEGELPAIALRKRSIDARRGQVRFHLLFELNASAEVDLGAPHPREVGPGRTLIVGDGPAPGGKLRRSCEHVVLQENDRTPPPGAARL